MIQKKIHDFHKKIYFEPLKLMDALPIRNCGEAVVGILVMVMKMDTVIEDVTRVSLIAMGLIVVEAHLIQS